jgi:hypothetical protein
LWPGCSLPTTTGPGSTCACRSATSAASIPPVTCGDGPGWRTSRPKSCAGSIRSGNPRCPTTRGRSTRITPGTSSKASGPTGDGLADQFARRRSSAFRPDVSPSRHTKCECSCVLPTTDVCRWLVLLLSGHRWPDAAPASDAGIGHYQAPGWSLRSGQLPWLPPLAGPRPGSLHGFHERRCFRVRREPAQDEGEGHRAHGVGVAVAEDAAAAVGHLRI